MYKSFFKLTKNPFDLTPDPSFLFPTEQHNEALAAIYYGVRRHKGFVVVTGEVGTGKTMILRCLLQLLSKSNDVSYAYIFNSLLSPNEFLQYIAADFGLKASGKSKGELLFELSQFLIDRNVRKQTTVLIVDEAHHLSVETLEEIRLLTNLETTEDKLLQIVLVGQPELNSKLDSIGLRQLKQRIALHAWLEPLNEVEVQGYIDRRLKIAGIDLTTNRIFEPQAISAICQHSRGIPRLINTICENSLIAAYARNMQNITPDIVDKVVRDLRLNVIHAPSPLKPADEHGDMDNRRAANALLELYTDREQDIKIQETA